jgi:hypothetical protein
MINIQPSNYLVIVNVCSITRRPANPITALGSAKIRSPNIAKLAVTPPVGDVKQYIINLHTIDEHVTRQKFCHLH